MRILALIPTMGPGGAERAMARLTWNLGERHGVVGWYDQFGWRQGEGGDS